MVCFLFSYVSKGSTSRLAFNTIRLFHSKLQIHPSQSIQTPRKLSCKEKPFSEAVLPAFSGGPSCPATATEVVVL